MRNVDQKFLHVLIKAIEEAQRDQHLRGVQNLTILWGYEWPDLSHDMAACSPPTNLTANQQAQIVESQYSAILAAGGSAARWVDGYPPNVVQSVANYLAVPVGQPSDWFDTTG